MSAVDIDHLRKWIGSERETVDEISPRLAASLAAVLDGDTALADGDAAPTCIHWCLSPEIAPMGQLGPDGHPARGGFLPPVPLPRRMWAGGSLRFSGDFRVGDRVRRRSRVVDVTLKTGQSGVLCFVTVTHDYTTPRGVALTEQHDIVYRALEPTQPAVAAAPAARPAPAPERHFSVEASPVLLMRYSAVTFNGHRIHYDRDYCLNEEGYPGLIVHGPLQATCLLHLARDMNGGDFPALFSFRGVSPLFDGGRFSVNGRKAGEGAGNQLWVASAAGVTTMTARAQ